MKNKNNISDLILSMDTNINLNLKKIKRHFGTLNYNGEDNQSILHILVDKKYDEEKTFYAITSLLNAGISPNLKADFNYNFIQTALYAGYSENFILKLIKESLKYDLDVNHVDEDGDTIVHTAIYSDDYIGLVYTIYKLLLENGFDSRIKNKNGYSILTVLNDTKNMKKTFSKEQTNILEKMYKESIEQFEESDQLYEEVKREKKLIKL